MDFCSGNKKIYNRAFRKEWTGLYGMVEKNGEAICLLCSPHKAFRCKSYNLKKHFEKRHNDLSKISFSERKEYILNKLRENKMCKCITDQSFDVICQLSEQNEREVCGGAGNWQTIKCYVGPKTAKSFIANCSRINENANKNITDWPLSVNIVEDTNMKIADMPLSGNVMEDTRFETNEMPLSENIVEKTHIETEDMPLSGDIIENIKVEISDMPIRENVIEDENLPIHSDNEKQFVEDLRKCNCFSIAVIEITDITSSSKLAIIARFSNGQTMREELISLESMSLEKTADEICKTVITSLKNLNIDLSKIVSVTTNGMPHMTNFVELFCEYVGHPVIPFHSIINQEFLYAKSGSTDMTDVISVVSQIVENIFSRPLNRSYFEQLFDIGNSPDDDINRLSKGKLLLKFVKCFSEIKTFLEHQSKKEFSQIYNTKWVCGLMFFADFSNHLEYLNDKLKEYGKTIDITFGYIKAFQLKLVIFKGDLNSKQFDYFPNLQKYSKSVSVDEELFIEFENIIQSLIEQFESRFSQFRKMEELLILLRRPDVVDYFKIDLSNFLWLVKKGDVIMEIVELKCGIWLHDFFDYNIEGYKRLEKKEELDILKIWEDLPQTEYKSVITLAMALLSIFPSTNFCDRLFPHLKRVKIKQEYE